MDYPPYSIMRVWKTMVETRIITEQGSFLKDNVPDDYGGPELEVKIMQRIIFTNYSGVLFELRLDDLKDVQDKDRNKGVGASVPANGSAIEREIAPTGPSTAKAVWVLEDAVGLPEVMTSMADLQHVNYVAREGAGVI